MEMQKERTFLHDLSNPLSIAHGRACQLLDRLNEMPVDMPKEELIVQVEKIVKALERTVATFKERQRLVRESEANDPKK